MEDHENRLRHSEQILCLDLVTLVLYFRGYDNSTKQKKKQHSNKIVKFLARLITNALVLLSNVTYHE